jgi:hypothetical protein
MEMQQMTACLLAEMKVDQDGSQPKKARGLSRKDRGQDRGRPETNGSQNSECLEEKKVMVLKVDPEEIEATAEIIEALED